MQKLIISLLALLINTLSFSQSKFDTIKIDTIPVAQNIYMLKGAGGNIAISVGEDGVFMIDDQFAPLSQKIKQAINTITKKPITFLINTHFHGDHTGGNSNFKAYGATIVAHDNVRKRLLDNPKTKTSALPTITFSDNTTFYLNQNDIFITHVHNAHTDGDALVYFAQSNVLHTGDTFFNGKFPFIDIARGGSIDGLIAAVKAGLMLTNQNTKIIPGHGAIATQKEYKTYYNMLVDIRKNIAQAIADGKTETEIKNMENATAAYYTDQESASFFITGERLRSTIYKSIIEAKKQ